MIRGRVDRATERRRDRRPEGMRLRGQLRRGEGPRRRRRRRGRRGRLYLRGGAVLDEAGRDKLPSPGSPARHRRNVSLANGVPDGESCSHSSYTCRSRPRATVARAAPHVPCAQSSHQALRRAASLAAGGGRRACCDRHLNPLQLESVHRGRRQHWRAANQAPAEAC